MQVTSYKCQNARDTKIGIYIVLSISYVVTSGVYKTTNPAQVACRLLDQSNGPSIQKFHQPPPRDESFRYSKTSIPYKDGCRKFDFKSRGHE